MARIYDYAVSDNFSRNASMFFSSEKLQMPVETGLLFCQQVVQLQHHLSGATLVPTKVDPVEKASSNLLHVEEEGKILPTFQSECFTSKYLSFSNTGNVCLR